MFKLVLDSVGKRCLSPRTSPPIIPLRRTLNTSHRQYASSASPRIATGTIWTSIIPKFLRDKSPGVYPQTKPHAPQQWNPATFYIVIFLLIGSNAIQMIALRNNHLAFSRKADAKIRLLKEIIERVKQGEDVDVEYLLGTGDEEKELEWSQVVEELIASDDQPESGEKSSQRSSEDRSSGRVSEYEATDEGRQEHGTVHESSKASISYSSDKRFL